MITNISIKLVFSQRNSIANCLITLYEYFIHELLQRPAMKVKMIIIRKFYRRNKRDVNFLKGIILCILK